MSESIPHYDASPAEDQPAAAQPGRATGGQALASLALLLGLAGLAVGGWSAWQLQQPAAASIAAPTSDLQPRLEALQEQLQAGFDQRLAALDAQLAGLPQAAELTAQRELLGSLQLEQQRLAEHLTDVLGKSRENWRLAEAEHLLRLAMLRLGTLQDVPSSIALLQTADDILRSQDDPQAFAARAELLKALEALRNLPALDRDGLFLQLAALRDQLDGLQQRAPEYQLGSPAGDQQVLPEGAWQKTLDELSRYVRIDLQADQQIRPLLQGQSLAKVRLALQLALEQAQWAALHGRTAVYQQALESARQVLDDYFDPASAPVAAMAARLRELAAQPVSVPLPSLDQALAGVQLYLRQRARLDTGAAAATVQEGGQ